MLQRWPPAIHRHARIPSQHNDGDALQALVQVPGNPRVVDVHAGVRLRENSTYIPRVHTLPLTQRMKRTSTACRCCCRDRRNAMHDRLTHKNKVRLVLISEAIARSYAQVAACNTMAPMIL
jgi:hypothetical protein